MEVVILPIQWLTIDQVSDQLGISTSTVRRRIKQGKLDSKKEGGKWLVSIETDSQMDNQVDQPNVTQLLSEIEHLRQVNNQLVNQLGQKDEQINQLHQLLAAETAWRIQPFWRRWWGKRKQLTDGTREEE